ncbi:MAG: hypothetical protein ABI867_22400 [Kofleriaceae bacterium]
MGRLDEIIERNRHPRRAVRNRKGIGVGLASIVLFGALVALIFTNLAQPPEDPPAPPSPPAEHRVRDVRLRPFKAKPAGSAAGSGSGSATTQRNP